MNRSGIATIILITIGMAGYFLLEYGGFSEQERNDLKDYVVKGYFVLFGMLIITVTDYFLKKMDQGAKALGLESFFTNKITKVIIFSFYVVGLLIIIYNEIIS